MYKTITLNTPNHDVGCNSCEDEEENTVKNYTIQIMLLWQIVQYHNIKISQHHNKTISKYYNAEYQYSIGVFNVIVLYNRLKDYCIFHQSS